MTVALLSCFSGCRDSTDGIRMVFRGDYTFTPEEQRTIAHIAGDAEREARQHLPALATPITVAAQSGTRVIPELGALGEVAPPDYVVWTVDTSRPEGVVAIAEAHLRAALLHEFHHLVRLTALPGNSVMDRVISEGMATAFERDFAQSNYPWSTYPDDVASWVEELLALPTEATREEWLANHPDRRARYKAGTYLVDHAMKTLGKSSAELVSMPTDDIVAARRR